MEVTSLAYNQTNQLQVKEAKELIVNCILKEHSGFVDIILDVGCGSGNVTKFLSESIPHGRLIAFDIDPKMVQFSRENHSDDNIEYLVQDIAQPWETLDPKLRALEGSVDLVFASYVLNWIRDKDTTFSNLFKLLKPGGAMYFNLSCYRSICKSLPLEEQEEIEKVFIMDSPEVQRQKFSNSLKLAGFDDFLVKEDQKIHEYESPEAFQAVLKLGRNFYSRCFVHEDVSEKIKLRIGDLVFKTYSVKRGFPLPEAFDFEQRTGFYDLLWGWAKKPCIIKIDSSIL